VVLELLTGETLLKTIQLRKGLFSKKEVRTIMSGLLSGLNHINSHRIMHRDLKPENIMMRGESMEPVIVDPMSRSISFLDVALPDMLRLKLSK